MRKSKLKTIINIGAALLTAGVLSGCSVKFGTNKETDLAAVVAHPTNGAEGMDVTYEMFRREYKYFLLNEGIEDDTEESVAAYCESQRESLLYYLVNQQIIVSHAKEMGIYDLTEEEQKEVDEGFDKQLAAQIQYYGTLAEQEMKSKDENASMTDEEKEEAGSKRLDEILEECGMTRDDMHWWAQFGKITEKLQKALEDTVTYERAEEEFRNAEKYAEETYNSNTEMFTMFGYDQVWLPEGSRLIKHILIDFDEETQNELRSLRSGGSDAEADKKRAEAAEKLKEKQEEIEKKLDDGESFDDLIKEYSADAEGSAAYPDGYTVIPNGQTYMAEFQKAAFVPAKIGDRTTCVTDYGVHIMLYAGIAEVSDESVKATIDRIFIDMKAAAFSDKMNEWAFELDYEIDYDALRLKDPYAATPDAG